MTGLSLCKNGDVWFFPTFGGAGFCGIGTASEFVSLWLAHLLMLAVTGDESEMNVCKTCTHLRLFDLFEINLRVSTTWNAKHMSLILNLIQHMEMFIRIRMLQTQSRVQLLTPSAYAF